MSFDRFIDSITRNPDGTATVRLVNRLNPPEPDLDLTCTNPPKDFDAAIGTRVWCDNEKHLMIGEKVWADRISPYKFRLRVARDFTDIVHDEPCGCKVTFIGAAEHKTSRMKACAKHGAPTRLGMKERDAIVERAKVKTRGRL